MLPIRSFNRKHRLRKRFTQFLVIAAVFTFLFTELALARPSEAAVYEPDTTVTSPQTSNDNDKNAQAEADDISETDNPPEKDMTPVSSDAQSPDADSDTGSSDKEESGSEEKSAEDHSGSSDGASAEEMPSDGEKTEDVIAEEESPAPTDTADEIDIPDIHTLTDEVPDDYKITIEYSDKAGLPEDVKLKVAEIANDSEQYNSFYHASVEKLRETMSENIEPVIGFARFFDITLYTENEGLITVVEPADNQCVKVSFTFAEKPVLEESSSPAVIHFSDESLTPEVMESKLIDAASLNDEIREETSEKASESENLDTFVYKQSHFSPVGFLTVSAVDNSPTLSSDSYNIHAVGAIPITDYSDLSNLEPGKYVITVEYNGINVVNSSRGLRKRTTKTKDGIEYITNLTEDEIWDISKNAETGQFTISNNGVYIDSLDGTGISATETEVNLISFKSGFNAEMFTSDHKGRYLRCESNRLTGAVAYSAGHTFYLARVVTYYDVPNFGIRVDSRSETIEDGFYCLEYSAIGGGDQKIPSLSKNISSGTASNYATYDFTPSGAYTVNGKTLTGFSGDNIWYVSSNDDGTYTIQGVNGTWLSRDTAQASLTIQADQGTGTFLVLASATELVMGPPVSKTDITLCAIPQFLPGLTRHTTIRFSLMIIDIFQVQRKSSGTTPFST